MIMRVPATPITRAQKAVPRQVKSPVSGINARDSFDSLKEGDAVDLCNWFPFQSYLETRLGYSDFSTMSATTGSVETLAQFHSGAVQKFLACGSGRIDDITTGTASNLATGLSEDRWQTEMFNGRLFLVNGTDAPRDYDGTTLSSTSWTGTGLTIADLIDVLAFKSRLYFVEKDTQSFWYGGINSVTGTLTEFDLGETGNFKGNLVTLNAITSDGGDGVDDLFVAMFSEGDVVIYQGSDPGSNFFQVGTFKIGKPIGQRPAKKIGSDVAVITEDGYVLLTQVLPFGRSRTDQDFSEKIQRIVDAAIQNYKSNTGWEIELHSTGSKLFVNVPVSATSSVQHVMNTNTRAWTIFEYSDKPVTWAIYNGDIYFGAASGKIFKAEDGTSDNGTAIVSTGQDGWTYLGQRTRIKRFLDIRPIFELETDTTADTAFLTDFETNRMFSTLELDVSEVTNSVWNVAVWDVATWGGALQTSQDWNVTSGVGYAGSLAFRTSSDDQQFRWIATTYVYEPGGVI